MKVEDLHDLRERVAQAVVQPGRPNHHAVAERRAGQRVGDDRFDQLLARRTPVAVDRVLGHFRLDFRNVFGITGAALPAPLHRAVTVRTNFGAVFLVVIDPFGRRASRAAMARLGPGLPLATLARRLLVGRLHARGRGRRLVRSGRAGRSLFSHLLAQLQQRKDHRLRTLRVDPPRLLFGQRSAPKNIQQTLGQSRRARCHAR